MNLAEVEAKIRAAVAQAKADGWKIRHNLYYVPGHHGAPTVACPLAACVPRDEIDDAARHAEVRERAAILLGLDPIEALHIVLGFDCDDYSVDEFARLGNRLRDLADPVSPC